MHLIYKCTLGWVHIFPQYMQENKARKEGGNMYSSTHFLNTCPMPGHLGYKRIKQSLHSSERRQINTHTREYHLVVGAKKKLSF